MTLHPLTVAGMTAEECGIELATRQMAERPGGIRVLMLSPRNNPDVIDCTLHVIDGKVEIRPAGDTLGVVGLGDDAYAQHPGSYGLAPCPCCDGDRWRVMLPVVYDKAVWEVLDYLGLFLSMSVNKQPELYCLKDRQALSAMRVPNMHPIDATLEGFAQARIVHRTDLFLVPAGEALRVQLLTPVIAQPQTVRFIEVDVFPSGDDIRLAVVDATTAFGREMQEIIDQHHTGVWSPFSIGIGKCECANHESRKWNPAGFALLCAPDSPALLPIEQRWLSIVHEQEDEFCPAMLAFLKQSWGM